MTSPNMPLQGALITKIKALNTAAGTKVTNLIQSTPGYPYVVVFPGFESPIDEECWDRTETTMQIDVWGDAGNQQHVKPIAAAIRDALHEQTIPIAGYTVDRMRVETVNYGYEPPLYRARISLSIETQPA